MPVNIIILSNSPLVSTSEAGLANKTVGEWEAVYGLIAAVQNGTPLPSVPNNIVGEFRQLFQAIKTAAEDAANGINLGGGGQIFFQDTDPGSEAGSNGIWVDFANERIGLRDGSNTSWTFFDSGGGIGTIGSSGYGLDGYGDLPWDTTVVNSSVLTTTPSLGLYKPLYATVGWGTWINANMDKIEAFNVRLLAVEAAAAVLP